MAYLLRNGSKINIKKSHRGRFTDYCGGTVTEACIQKGKRSSDPKIRKQAIFAQNARKFKHQYGGVMYGQAPMYTSPYGQQQSTPQQQMPVMGMPQQYQMQYLPWQYAMQQQPQMQYQAPLMRQQQNTVYGQPQIHTNTNLAANYYEQISQQQDAFKQKQAIQQQSQEAERQASIQKAQGIGTAIGEAAGMIGQFAYDKIKSNKEIKRGSDITPDTNTSGTTTAQPGTGLQQTNGQAFFQTKPLQAPTPYVSPWNQQPQQMKDGGNLIRKNKQGSSLTNPITDYFVYYSPADGSEKKGTKKESKEKEDSYKEAPDYELYLPPTAAEAPFSKDDKDQDEENWFKHDEEPDVIQDTEHDEGDDSGTGQFDSDFKTYGRDPIFTHHKKFWRNLVKSESGFRPYVMNKEGAYGYFQIMPASRTGESIKTQFEDAARLMKSHMGMIDTDDRRLAKQQGITEEGIMAGVWLGGPRGVKRALRGKGNAKDSNGTSVMGYMIKFSK